MTNNVLVMLSSYNGEQYIEEQIETILAQEDVVVSLLVRDDGSTDSTPKILERYKREGKLEYYIGNNIGWRRSFMQLIQDAPDSDYYAFADQDDHWLPSKLKMAVTCMKTMAKGPQLYNSNGNLWKDGKVVGRVCESKPHINAYSRFINPLGQGSTQVFNRELLQIVRRKMPGIVVAHDAWLARLSILLGCYYYDYNSYILYRQHENNQLGADTSVGDTLRRRIKKYASVKKNHYLDSIAREMLICYADILNAESYKICYTIANYRHSFSCLCSLLFSPKYRCDKLLTTLGFKYKVLLRGI